MLPARLLAQSVPDEAALNDPARQIQWARTVAAAYEEARLRDVPVLSTVGPNLTQAQADTDARLH